MTAAWAVSVATLTSMGFPDNVLASGERVERSLHPHWLTVLGPTLLGVVLRALALATVWVTPDDSKGNTIQWVAVAVLVLIALPLVLVPFLRWLTSTYTLTDRRVITRHGIVTTTGHDLPLSRINNVTYERSLLDRLLGCGTLQFTTAAEAPVTLPDVPDVERVHVIMTELLFGDAEGDNRGPEGRD